jgi:hypothetical protein
MVLETQAPTWGRSKSSPMRSARIRGNGRGHTILIPLPRAQNSNEFVIVHLLGCGMRALATWPLGWAVTAIRSSLPKTSRMSSGPCP